jgi:hypothetical protein
MDNTKNTAVEAGQDALTLRNALDTVVQTSKAIGIFVVGKVKSEYKKAGTFTPKGETEAINYLAKVDVICDEGDTITLSFDQSFLGRVPALGSRVALKVIDVTSREGRMRGRIHDIISILPGGASPLLAGA